MGGDPIRPPAKSSAAPPRIPGASRLLLVLALLLPAIFAAPGAASAQPCQVIQEKAYLLQAVASGKKCGDSGVLCASTVNIAVDPTTQLPVVIWYSDDHKVRSRRFDGAAWAPAKVVPTPGITLPLGSVVTLRGLAHAFDSKGRMHLIISGGKKVFHLEKGSSWSAPQPIHTISHSNLTHLSTHVGFDAQDRMHVVYWYEAGGGHIYYAQKTSSGWSSWTKIGNGRHIDVAFHKSGTVHVSWTSKLSSNPANWQAFYKRMDAQGKWLPQEKVTNEKPVSQNIGPVAISPSVAVDAAGLAHLLYPVDPPETKGDDDGHASYTWRNAAGTWSQPKVLFNNARHSARTALVVDGAGVKYAFGLNLKCRLAVDPLSGNWTTSNWHSHAGGYRFFYLNGTYTNSGAWLVYMVGREWGSVEVIHLRRIGSCACEKQGFCAPKQTMTQACGTCGKQTRVCGNYCNWGPWSPCQECPGQDSGRIPDNGATPEDSNKDISRMDTGTDPSIAGGCGCGIPRGSEHRDPWIWVLLVLLLVYIKQLT